MWRRIVVGVFGPSKVKSIVCSAVYCLLFAWTTVVVLAGNLVLALLPGALTLLWILVLAFRFSITKAARDKVIALSSLVIGLGGPLVCAGGRPRPWGTCGSGRAEGRGESVDYCFYPNSNCRHCLKVLGLIRANLFFAVNVSGCSLPSRRRRASSTCS